MKPWLALIPLGALMAATASTAGEKSLTYPPTKRVDRVDDYLKKLQQQGGTE